MLKVTLDTHLNTFHLDLGFSAEVGKTTDLLGETGTGNSTGHTNSARGTPGITPYPGKHRHNDHSGYASIPGRFALRTVHSCTRCWPHHPTGQPARSPVVSPLLLCR